MGVKLLRSVTGLCGMLCLLLCTAPVHAVVTPGSSYLAYYTSTIDNSVQPYGVYVPATYTSFALHPVVFNGHGFGGSANSSFSSAQMTFADANGWLIVQVQGRGNTFYDGVGEVDFLDVLALLQANFTLDMDRLYFEGGSMGATGAYRLGIRHPDILAAVGGADGFADYRQWYTQYYGPAANPSYVAPFRLPNLLMASCVDTAENAKWQSIDMYVDGLDTNVWPANTYNFNSALNAWETVTPLETDYVHTMVSNPNGGHDASYNQIALYNYFLGKSLVQNPTDVACTTTQLKYGKVHWVSIDRMQIPNTFAALDAAARPNTGGGGSTITVTASNVLQYTLYLNEVNLLNPTMSNFIVTNGVSSPSLTGQASTQPLTMYAVLDVAGNITGWSDSNPFPDVLHKTAAMEGPIGHAYTSSFIVVYGSAADKTEADNFCSLWNLEMGASITSQPDSSVTTSDQENSNLILFGTADSNPVLSAIQSSLPIKVSSAGITIGPRKYTGTNYGAYFVYPNPNYPNRYVVVSHLIIPGSRQKDLEALPWYWPDYVIFDTNLSAGACIQSSLAYLPSTFVEAGYFDAYWILEPVPTVGLTSSANPAALGQPITLTATVSAVAPATPTPTGTVTFMDGTTILGTQMLVAGVAHFVTSSLAVGSQPITASYSGDNNYSPGTSTGLTQIVATWAPLSAVAAPDGTTHLLWGNGTGEADLRILSPDGSTKSDTILGPFAGWQALALSAAPDNSNHILWQYTDGTVSIWKIDEPGELSTLTYTLYGPYAGWSPIGIATASDSSDHVLWKYTDNTMSTWRIAPSGAMTYRIFGPYPGWTPIALAVAPDPDLSDHVIWKYTDNTMSAWRINPSGAMTYQIYGPYPGWTPVSIGVDRNFAAHILWNYLDGTMSMWNLSSAGALSCELYGPFAGWSAAAVSVGPVDDHDNVLWTYPDGTLSVWNISSPGDFTYNIQAPPGK